MPPLTWRTFGDIANKAATPLQWVVVLGIAYTLASTVTFFAKAPLEAKPRQSIESAPQIPKVRQQSAATDLEAILQANLFGKAQLEAKPAAVSEPTVETRLPLNLLGVFVAEEADGSAAIIAEKGKAGRLYNLGEAVSGNATLGAVHADHVVLLRAGARETLKFPKLKGFEHRKAVEAPPAEAAAPARAPQKVQDFIAAYQERSTERPEQVEQLLDELAVEAASGGGYRVGDLSTLPYLSRTGLAAGDLILSLNGLAVSDLNADQLALQDLLAAGDVRIEVQRGERRFFVTASLNP